MNYLFDEKESSNIISRINNLSANSKPLWGKMTVAQMLAHLQAPILVSIGESTLKRNIFGILFGKMAKKVVVGDKPYKRGLPTAPSFIVKDQRDFNKEKERLIELVKKFSSGGPEGLTKKPHPFFGVMSADEWNKSQWKHLDHHLQQFGV
jgi:hypothetical protein